MKKNIISFLLVFSALYSINVTASDIDFEEEEIESVQFIDGQAIITLDEEIQKNSGLMTLKLKPATFQPETIAYGSSVNILPLLTIRKQLLAAKTKQIAAKARLNQAERNITRLRQLHQGDAISTRKLQHQQSQLQSDKAIYSEMSFQRALISNTSKLQWGATITDWLSTQDITPLNDIITGNATLIKIALPAGKYLSAINDTIYIDQVGNRNTAKPASYIAQLPQVNILTQGTEYLFLTNSPSIKTGMNVSAWLTEKGNNLSGVIIPESSLAWHLGQALVFIKLDDENFAHRTINQPIKIANGYFITEQIKADEEIVVIGTQMLLSHEFRSQIPDEDDDD